MKRFLVVLLLVASFVFANDASAQHFDIWDWITDPQAVRYDNTHPITRAIALSNSRLYLPVAIREQVDDFFPMVSAKIALLAYDASRDGPTHALLSRAVPTGDTAQREVRYMAAFKREVQLGYASLPQLLSTWLDFTGYDPIWRVTVEYEVSAWLGKCSVRAKQIVTQMTLMESKRMIALASDVDFVRDSAQVKLNEVPGFMLTSGRQNINLQTRPGKTARFYSPLTTLSMSSAERISVGTAGTATIHITGKSLPTLISLGGATPIVLEPNGNRSLTAAEVARGVKVWVQAVPTVTTHVANQTLGVAVIQSVSYAFEGENLTYAVASSQPSVCTVRLSETAGTAVLTGVRAGNSTITITATNSSGSAVISFIATVQ